MSRHKLVIPSYRLHRQSGQAVVTLTDAATGRRRDVLLGPHGSAASRAEYARVLAEWEAARRSLPHSAAAPDLTVNELLAAYWAHAQEHYRHVDGSPTGTTDNIRLALRPLRELYGDTPAAAFGPLALRTVRERMIAAGLARRLINGRIGIIRRVFKWAVSMEMVPPSIHHGLAALAGLKRGRTQARESEPVRPAPAADVDAALPHLRPPVAAMVQLMRLTGMRPGEVVVMRPVDLDTAGAVWTYRPQHHKGSHHGRERAVCLGPRAQAVVAPFLAAAGPDEFVFSPARDRAAQLAARTAARKTPRWRSHMRRNARKRKARPQRAPRAMYDKNSFRWAVARACQKAGVPPWFPYQLRHLHATEVRKRFGLEAAQVALGHAKADVTQVYAERDLTLAERVAAELG